MGESIGLIKNALRTSIEILNGDFSDSLPKKEIKNVIARIQSAQDVLIQNERKIWLRTKKGKEMLNDFDRAAETLLKVLKEFDDSDEFKNINTAVDKIEFQAKRLIEETRRRSMVVT